jgi:hypothetical protein
MEEIGNNEEESSLFETCIVIRAEVGPIAALFNVICLSPENTLSKMDAGPGKGSNEITRAADAHSRTANEN